MSCLHCSARCQDLSFGKSINSTKCDLYCQTMNLYQSYTSCLDAWSLFSSCEWHSLQRCGKEGLTTQRYEWLSAHAVLCMNNRGQYNTGEQLIYTIRCFIFLSVSHFVPFLSAPHLISVFFLSIQFHLLLFVCLSSSRCARVRIHTHTHTHTVQQCNKYTCTHGGWPMHKCEVISSLIHPAQLWATMRVIRKE